MFAQLTSISTSPKSEQIFPKEEFMDKTKATYKDAGVDIDEGNLFVKLILPYAKQTLIASRYKAGGEIGGYSGVFPIPETKMALTAGTDGVGTKLDLAKLLDLLDTVGIDLVAMCVNDIITDGAIPLFFLDYLCVGKLCAEKHAQLVKGIADGCILAKCALIGGETAEHPGTCPEDYFDLAGFCAGLLLDITKRITGKGIKSGMYVHGLVSSGLHSNGFSLCRKVTGLRDATTAQALEILNTYQPSLRKTLGQEVMIPTNIYATQVAEILENYEIEGMGHITGGGLVENPPRVLPDGCAIEINLNAWRRQEIFYYLQKLGNIDPMEMLRTFNCGIGYILFSPEARIQGAINIGMVISHSEKKVFFEGKF